MNVQLRLFSSLLAFSSGLQLGFLKTFFWQKVGYITHAGLKN